MVLNLDREAAARLRVPPEMPMGPPLAWTDPVTGAAHPLPDGADLELGPSGVLVIHQA